MGTCRAPDQRQVISRFIPAENTHRCDSGFRIAGYRSIHQSIIIHGQELSNGIESQTVEHYRDCRPVSGCRLVLDFVGTGTRQLSDGDAGLHDAEYQTDTSRAINAYEKLMERYMDTTERNFDAVSMGIKMMAVKLDALDAKLTALDARLARIEQHLGIVTAPPASDPNAPAVLPQKPKPQAVPGTPITVN